MTNNNCCEKCHRTSGIGISEFDEPIDICINSACRCHTSPVSKEKPEHDGTCRTPECYIARGNKVFDGNTGEQIREYSKPSPVAVQEGWASGLLKIAEPLYDADADKQTIAIFEEQIVRYVDALLSRHNLALVEAVKAKKEKESLIVIGFDGKTKTTKITERGYEEIAEHFRIIGKNEALDAVIEIIKPKV